MAESTLPNMTCALQWWLKMDALRLYIRALEISLLTYLHVPSLHIVRKKYDNLNYTERKTTELSPNITKSLLNYNFEDICTVFQQEVAWMSLKPVTKRTQSKFILEDTPKILSNAVLIQLQSVPEKMAQSLRHHIFAKVSHRVVQFWAQCPERNCLHNKSEHSECSS